MNVPLGTLSILDAEVGCRALVYLSMFTRFDLFLETAPVTLALWAVSKGKDTWKQFTAHGRGYG